MFENIFKIPYDMIIGIKLMHSLGIILNFKDNYVK